MPFQLFGIPPTLLSLSSVTKICAQCEMEDSADGLMEQMCSSDFGEYGLSGPRPCHCPRSLVQSQPHVERAERGLHGWAGLFKGCKLSQRWMGPSKDTGPQDRRVPCLLESLLSTQCSSGQDGL